MQLSYSLIKKEQALSGDTKKIVTDYGSDRRIDSEEANNYSPSNENESVLKNYENIGNGIILEAQKKRDEILIEAMRESQIREKEAYEKGYTQGRSNGYEDGRNEALEKFIPQAEEQSREIIKKAESILLSAEKDYKEYLDEKRKEIVDLALTIAEKILHREILKDDGINDIVEEAISESKGEENIIIKCNPIHESELRDKTSLWKTNYSIKGEIFILVSENINPGNAIVEKNSGKIEVGLEIGLEQVRNAILG